MTDFLDKGTISSILVTILTLIFCSSLTSAATVDFATLGKDKNYAPQVPANAKDLNQLVRSIWQFRIADIQLETTVVDNKVLWVLADRSSIHATLGFRNQFYPGTNQETFPGQILRIDLNPLIGKQNQVTLVVNYETRHSLFAKILRLRIGDEGGVHVETIYHSKWKTLRPIGGLYYYQKFTRDFTWSRWIARLKETGNRFVQGLKLNLPDAARVMSLEQRPRNGWMFLDEQGDFVITKYGRIQDEVTGPMGSTPKSITLLDRSPTARLEREPLRLPPVKVSRGRFIAVVDNPRNDSGLFNWFSGSEYSYIRLYKIENDRLVNVGNIGPYEHEILDLEVPAANPNQLLWFRHTGGRPTVLEMIDFSRVSPSLLSNQ